MVIATIKKEPSTGRLKAEKEDGSSFFIPLKLCFSMHLHEGMELDEELYSKLHHASLSEQCYSKALELLASQEHTRLLLSDKLVRKGFPREIVNEQLQALIEEGSLDEGRYARAFIESRLRRKIEGRMMMAARLAAKGVDSAIAAQALDEAYSPDSVDLMLGSLVGDSADSPELRAMLAKRGFTSYEIARHLRSRA